VTTPKGAIHVPASVGSTRRSSTASRDPAACAEHALVLMYGPVGRAAAPRRVPACASAPAWRPGRGAGLRRREMIAVFGGSGPRGARRPALLPQRAVLAAPAGRDARRDRWVAGGCWLRWMRAGGEPPHRGQRAPEAPIQAAGQRTQRRGGPLLGHFRDCGFRNDSTPWVGRALRPDRRALRRPRLRAHLRRARRERGATRPARHGLCRRSATAADTSVEAAVDEDASAGTGDWTSGRTWSA